MTHAELSQKLNYLFSDDYFQRELNKLHIFFVYLFVLPFTLLCATLFFPGKLPFAEALKFYMYFKIILIFLCIIVIALYFTSTHAMRSNYLSNVKGKFPQDIKTFEQFTSLYMMTELQRILTHYTFEEPTPLDIITKEFQGNTLHLTYRYKEQIYTKETTIYSSITDGESPCIMASTISSDVIYGFMEGDIFNIVLLNIDMQSPVENFANETAQFD